MEDRLKSLKKSMNQRTFHELSFTEQHKKNILEKVKNQTESDSDIQLAVMQLLVQAKTGFELMGLLRGRGIKRFEKNEGSLYTILHHLEHAGWLQSQWDDEGVKSYVLKDKGRKLLRKVEAKQTQQKIVFKALFEGGGE